MQYNTHGLLKSQTRWTWTCATMKIVMHPGSRLSTKIQVFLTPIWPPPQHIRFLKYLNFSGQTFEIQTLRRDRANFTSSRSLAARERFFKEEAMCVLQTGEIKIRVYGQTKHTTKRIVSVFNLFFPYENYASLILTNNGKHHERPNNKTPWCLPKFMLVFYGARNRFIAAPFISYQKDDLKLVACSQNKFNV